MPWQKFKNLIKLVVKILKMFNQNSSFKLVILLCGYAQPSAGRYINISMWMCDHKCKKQVASSQPYNLSSKKRLTNIPATTITSACYLSLPLHLPATNSKSSQPFTAYNNYIFLKGVQLFQLQQSCYWNLLKHRRLRLLLLKPCTAMAAPAATYHLCFNLKQLLVQLQRNSIYQSKD